jgi:Siphovirus Gp157
MGSMSNSQPTGPAVLPRGSDKPVSAWHVEQAMSVWQSARARLLRDDPSLERDEAALSELLGPDEGDIESILARTLRAARHAKAMADAAAQQIEDMQARKQRYAGRNEALRGMAFAIMDALGRPKFELPDLTASIRNGQPSVILTNEEKVPDIYVRTERRVDKATILNALKSGLTVEGCELSNSLPTLSIRTK